MGKARLGGMDVLYKMVIGVIGVSDRAGEMQLVANTLRQLVNSKTGCFTKDSSYERAFPLPPSHGLEVVSCMVARWAASRHRRTYE